MCVCTPCVSVCSVVILWIGNTSTARLFTPFDTVWLPAGSGYQERAAGPPQLERRPSLWLTLHTWKETSGSFGSDLAGGAFPSFSHLGTWEVCERVRVQSGRFSYVCVCTCVLKHVSVSVSPAPSHPPTHSTPHVILTTRNLPWQPARFTCTVPTCVRTRTWAMCQSDESPVSGL